MSHVTVWILSRRKRLVCRSRDQRACNRIARGLWIKVLFRGWLYVDQHWTNGGWNILLWIEWLRPCFTSSRSRKSDRRYLQISKGENFSNQLTDRIFFQSYSVRGWFRLFLELFRFPRPVRIKLKTIKMKKQSSLDSLQYFVMNNRANLLARHRHCITERHRYYLSLNKQWPVSTSQRDCRSCEFNWLSDTETFDMTGETPSVRNDDYFSLLTVNKHAVWKEPLHNGGPE